MLKALPLCSNSIWPLILLLKKLFNLNRIEMISCTPSRLLISLNLSQLDLLNSKLPAKIMVIFDSKFFETENFYLDLNLKKDDIKLMIENLKQSNVDSVTADELYNALYKQN